MPKERGSIKPILNADGQPIIDRVGRVKYLLRFYIAGKQVKRKRFFGSEEEARQYMRSERGDAGSASSWRSIFSAWADDSENAEDYIGKVRHSVERLVGHLGDVNVDETLPATMREYLKWRRNNPSKSAAEKDLRHFKSISRWARSEYIITDIPWEHIRAPKNTPKEREPIPLDQVRDHLDALDKWTRPIVLFICLAGCRQQDAAGLREDDIQGDRARLYVKGGEMPDYILDADLQAAIDEARELKAKNNLGTKWIFCNSVGGRWTDQHLAHRIREQWNRIGSTYSLHSLRHTFATIAGKEFDADMLKAGLAHKSRLTSERYSHVHRDAEARHKVGQYVRGILREHLGDLIPNKAQNKAQQGPTNNTQQHHTTSAYVYTDPETGAQVHIPQEVVDKIRQDKHIS